MSSTVIGPSIMNSAGQIVFRANTTGTHKGRGLWTHDVEGEGLSLVALTGETAPDVAGQFLNFHALRINRAGKVAFFGELAGGTIDDSNDPWCPEYRKRFRLAIGCAYQRPSTGH